MSDAKTTVAVLGATGLVGREIVSLIGERQFPAGELRLYASERSEGEEVDLGEQSVPVERMPDSLPAADVTFVCLPAAVARPVVDALAGRGSIVIDLSASQGLAGILPLADGEEARSALARRLEKSGVLAVPSPASQILALPLRALGEVAAIRRVVATILVSASAFGSAEVARLSRQTVALLNSQELEAEAGERAVAFDCQLEETGLADRVPTQVRHLASLGGPVSVTIVRASTFHAQAAAVTLQTEPALSVEQASRALREAPSLLLAEPPAAPPSTLDVIGSDAIHVGGIVQQASDPAWIRIWAASDNVHQGGALAALALAEAALRIRTAH